MKSSPYPSLTITFDNTQIKCERVSPAMTLESLFFDVQRQIPKISRDDRLYVFVQGQDIYPICEDRIISCGFNLNERVFLVEKTGIDCFNQAKDKFLISMITSIGNIHNDFQRAITFAESEHNSLNSVFSPTFLTPFKQDLINDGLSDLFANAPGLSCIEKIRQITDYTFNNYPQRQNINCRYCSAKLGKKFKYLDVLEEEAFNGAFYSHSYQCFACEGCTRIPVYHKVSSITSHDLEHVQYAPEEIVLVFLGICTALGFTANTIIFPPSHYVSAEVWAEDEGRYIAVDPVSNSIDAPLQRILTSYVSLAVAVGNKELRDVTARYSPHHSYLKAQDIEFFNNYCIFKSKIWGIGPEELDRRAKDAKYIQDHFEEQKRTYLDFSVAYGIEEEDTEEEDQEAEPKAKKEQNQN